MVSVKTKQKQYQSFIQNGQNRKQDINLKLQNISQSLIEFEPKIRLLKEQKLVLENSLMQEQHAYSELKEVLTVKSSAGNAENLKFHQQKNKVSSIDKDLEYRESQENNLEPRIDKNQIELENTKSEILQVFNHIDHHDEDLITMYQQKAEMEKAAQNAEIDYYSSKGKLMSLKLS